MKKIMKRIAIILIGASLVLIPGSMLLPTEYQADVFITGASALGFGIGLMISSILIKSA